jgi:hypothetical protein
MSKNPLRNAEIPKINLNIIVEGNGARGVLKLSKDEKYIV